jgi:hypothetical protein
VREAQISASINRRTAMQWMGKASALALVAGVCAAQAQPARLTVRDLDGKNPRALSKDEVTQLTTGAKVSRISARGSRNQWTNEPSGSFIASSDNSGANAVANSQGRSSQAPGKWHISDDGRYCIFIEWKTVGTEEWCRFVLETSDGHYLTRSLKDGTERVDKYEFSR